MPMLRTWPRAIVIAAVLSAATACLIRAQGTSVQSGSALSVEQRVSLEAGRQVIIARDESGSPWPRIHVHQLIDATPEEAAAVFTDYDRHSVYIPSLRESRVVQRPDALTAVVEYTLSVPFAPDERYAVRDRLAMSDSGGAYGVTWTLVRATSTRATDGSVRFKHYWHDRLQRTFTLMTYENFVTPGSQLARLPFVRSKAMRQMRDTAAAIASQVERERATDRRLLEVQVAALRVHIQESSRAPK